MIIETTHTQKNIHAYIIKEKITHKKQQQHQHHQQQQQHMHIQQTTNNKQQTTTTTTYAYTTKKQHHTPKKQKKTRNTHKKNTHMHVYLHRHIFYQIKMYMFSNIGWFAANEPTSTVL